MQAAVKSDGGAEEVRMWPDSNAKGPLAEKLRKIAPDGEVLVAISDHNLVRLTLVSH